MATLHDLATEIAALERHQSTLRRLRRELTASVRVMGPGAAGRRALGPDVIPAFDALDATYARAVAELVAQFEAMEAASEAVVAMRSAA